MDQKPKNRGKRVEDATFESVFDELQDTLRDAEKNVTDINAIIDRALESLHKSKSEKKKKNIIAFLKNATIQRQRCEELPKIVTEIMAECSRGMFDCDCEDDHEGM